MAKKNIHQDRFEEEIYPMSARLRDLTYTRQLKVDLEVSVFERDKNDNSRTEKHN
jgi:DNA-directed RNA polymerase II subunit RPB2